MVWLKRSKYIPAKQYNKITLHFEILYTINILHFIIHNYNVIQLIFFNISMCSLGFSWNYKVLFFSYDVCNVLIIVILNFCNVLITHITLCFILFYWFSKSCILANMHILCYMNELQRVNISFNGIFWYAQLFWE